MLKVITVLFSLFYCTFSLAEPTVWQAKKGQLTFVLMGSVHMGKPDFYPLPSSILDPFSHAKGLIVEADLTRDTQFDIPQGATTKSLLNKQELRRLTKIAQEIGVPEIALYNMPPWQAAMAIQQAQSAQFGLDATLGVDLHFLSLAQKKDIPIIAFETVQEQLDMIASMGKDGLPLLADTLNYWEDSKALLPCMFSAWESGDSQTMTAIVDDMMQEAGVLEHVIFTDRNENWVQQLSDTGRFTNGTYTVVVGALHFYGEEGLLALLESKGFTIETLTESRKADCDISALLSREGGS
ncbi:TraB/GumN family protein [Enterovibrio sp. 27052020O]|uniref:TraB/GumN family protein n=1 Tax=Enterovibrio sp. 27052020O TaxID=3241166 RepID=UPI00388E2B76